MSPITKLLLITRPIQFIAAGLGAWVVAINCNGVNPFSANKIAAAAAIGLNCLAASVFHYGAADYMYRRKAEAAPVKHPMLLVCLGLTGFALSIAVAWSYLPAKPLSLIIGNVVVLLLYPRVLSRMWWTKNLPIAYVCTTPILIGWWSGTHTNDILPFVTPAVFFLYGAREVIKDIHDRQTNHLAGRVTMPIRFPVTQAMRLAGLLTIIGIAFISLLMLKSRLPLASAALVVGALGIFAATASQLLAARDAGRTHQQITAGVYSLIWAVMLFGIGR